ncbi:unnamed protein product [Ceutorhynchus assimilis]|uniref:Integrin alpha second immunoglobulin-like domain-containing protein n=1 Tax=Ceutorhynchus assimilis TaxID=467358 RepID=A0A9N9QHR2_9CUCU|nr:unnamed protein product [Ceutorhynchus assimilis]
MTSASGWHDTFTRLNNTAAAQGSFYIENINKKTFKNRYNPLEKPEISERLPYYQRSLAGFSLHFPQVRYALTSGYFYHKSELHYVTGLPRGFHENRLYNVPYGMVLIFTFDNAPTKIRNEVKSKLKEELFGTQFGEYFGSSLAAGDLNADGFDDLIVGAPYRSNDKTGYNHGSVYVFYGHNRKLQFGMQNRIDGGVSGGRFGTALMVLGDLDHDGYNDVVDLTLKKNYVAELAISAPNEDESGVIYIYTFDTIMKTLKIFQRIQGKHINSKLKGFGMSLSRAIDIDDNDFPDFAIGSPLSGHTVILRTKPTISWLAKIEIYSLLLSKDMRDLSFQCCYNFTGYAGENSSILRNVTVDRDFNRFSFKESKNSEEKVINIEQDMENIKYCDTINLIRTEIHNYNDPIPITLSYRIAENQKANQKNPIVIDSQNIISADTFCKTCPQLSEKSQTTDTKLVFWLEKCNHFGQLEPCIAKLEIEARFLGLFQKNTFILGSKELLTLEVNVTNNGDAAFSPFLEILLPSGASLSTGHADCQTRGNDGLIIRCEREILESKTEMEKHKNMANYVLKLVIDVEDTNELNFSFKASTITKHHSDKSTYNLILKIKRDAHLFIEGYSNESSYIYEQGKPTLIQNIFKIQKFGISPTSPVDVEILVPTQIQNSKGKFAQIVKILEQNDTSLENVPITCQKPAKNSLEKINSIPFQAIRRESTSTIPLNLLILHCNKTNVTCTSIKCTVGPFDGSQNHAELSIEMEVDFRSFDGNLDKEWTTDIDQVIITSSASVFSSDFIIDGGNNRSDSTHLENIVSIYKDFVISLWILVGSAVAGLVILICLSMGLGKAGFFERKKLKMLQKLREDELEEERIIEEMIQKELEGHPSCEGDPVLRYAKPADLETYWSIMEKNALYNDPLLLMANRELEAQENNA